MFEQLSKPLKVNAIYIFLLVITFLTYTLNVVARKYGKLITHRFWFTNLSLDNKYNIVVIVFSFDLKVK
jgi:hypothetical protein